VRQEIEAIYRQHRQGLFTLALTLTGRCELAEDAIHDAFARLWKLKFQPPGDTVAYVFASVRNAAIDQLRRRRPACQDSASIYDGKSGPQADAMAAETRDLVRIAIESLPQDQREAVVMKVYGCLTFEQIAKTLGEPLATVASRYRRAMDVLKARLEGKI